MLEGVGINDILSSTLDTSEVYWKRWISASPQPPPGRPFTFKSVNNEQKEPFTAEEYQKAFEHLEKMFFKQNKYVLQCRLCR